MLKTKMPSKLDRLCVNSGISFPLNQEDVNLLAEACAEIGDSVKSYASVEVFFTGGRDIKFVISA